MTTALVAFPMSMFFRMVALLLVAAHVILALRALPRTPRWWYVLVALSVLPLTQTDWLLLSAGMMSTLRAQVLLDMPTVGLLLLLGAQFYLLRRAYRFSKEETLEAALLSARRTGVRPAV